MEKIKTVFMGSPAFSVPSLSVVAEKTQVLAVVCQPDKPSGRGLSVSSPAIKQAAEKLSLPIKQPLTIRKDPAFLAELSALSPDLIVVVAYGKILPAEVLQIPKFGCWNVHGSILPKYRGAAPIQWALIKGEEKTGVTLMKMDEGMDTGATFFSEEIPISQEDTSGTLHEKLSILGASVLRKGLEQLEAGILPLPTKQNSSLSTLAPLLAKEHGFVDFTRTAAEVSGQIRGVDPWPGAYTYPATQENMSIKVFSPKMMDGKGIPGEVLGVSEHGLVIACGQGAISIAELQAPGKKRLPAAAFLAGFPLTKGTLLGNGKPNPLL